MSSPEQNQAELKLLEEYLGPEANNMEPQLKRRMMSPTYNKLQKIYESRHLSQQQKKMLKTIQSDLNEHDSNELLKSFKLLETNRNTFDALQRARQKLETDLDHFKESKEKYEAFRETSMQTYNKLQNDIFKIFKKHSQLKKDVPMDDKAVVQFINDNLRNNYSQADVDLYRRLKQDYSHKIYTYRLSLIHI